MDDLAIRHLLTRVRYALDEARRTISVDHPVRIQIESAIAEVDAVDALEQPEIVLSDELREKLSAAMAESDRLGPPIIAPDAAWTYHAVKGQAAVACRTHDQHNRRITDFISLDTSPGRNAVADAELIAKLLNEDARLRADALAPPESTEKPKCPRCHGTGYIPSETCNMGCVDCQDVCPVCKGQPAPPRVDALDAPNKP